MIDGILCSASRLFSSKKAQADPWARPSSSSPDERDLVRETIREEMSRDELKREKERAREERERVRAEDRKPAESRGKKGVFVLIGCILLYLLVLGLLELLNFDLALFHWHFGFAVTIVLISFLIHYFFKFDFKATLGIAISNVLLLYVNGFLGPTFIETNNFAQAIFNFRLPLYFFTPTLSDVITVSVIFADVTLFAEGIDNRFGWVIKKNPVFKFMAKTFYVIAGTACGLFIIFTLVSVSAISAYGEYVTNCDEFRPREEQGYNSLSPRETLIKDYQTPGFRSCVVSSVWENIPTMFGSKLNPTELALKIIDNQIYRATGDYYFSKVDQNSKRPVGIFIKYTPKQSGYDVNYDFQIPFFLEVQTIGDTISGDVSCSLNNLPANDVSPSGSFRIDSSLERRFNCLFSSDKYSRGKYDFKVLLEYDTSTFAYMVPTLIKTSVWEDFSLAQRNEITKKLSADKFITTNAPIKIAGEVQDIEPVDPNPETFIDVGFSLTNNTWDKGNLKDVKELFMILPEKFELVNLAPTTSGVTTSLTCNGFVFEELSSCEEIKSILSEEDYPQSVEFCGVNDVKERVYRLNQRDKNRKVKQRDSIQCKLKAKTSDLFTNEQEQEIALEQVPIKLFTTYRYKVEEKHSVTLERDSQLWLVEPEKQSCTTERVKKDYAKHNETYLLEVDSVRAYAQRYQEDIKDEISKLKNSNNNFHDLSVVEVEALAAAIMYGYSGFQVNSESDIDDNGIIDYLSGCNYHVNGIGKEDEGLDRACLLSSLSFVAKKAKDLGVPSEDLISFVLYRYYAEGSLKEEDLSIIKSGSVSFSGRLLGSLTGGSIPYREQYKQAREVLPKVRADMNDYYAWLHQICEEDTSTASTTTPSSTPTSSSSITLLGGFHNLLLEDEFISVNGGRGPSQSVIEILKKVFNESENPLYDLSIISREDLVLHSEQAGTKLGETLADQLIEAAREYIKKKHPNGNSCIIDDHCESGYCDLSAYECKDKPGATP